MEDKICPLLLALRVRDSSVPMKALLCQRDSCAWYYSAVDPDSEQVTEKCSILRIAEALESK